MIAKRMRVQRETYEVAAILEQALARNKRTAHIGPHYSMEVMRALESQCTEVEPMYRLQQVNRQNNYLMGYLIKW